MAPSQDRAGAAGSGNGRGDATEVATSIADLVHDRAALPETTARDLLRLLGHSLASDSAAQRRQARLGLLIELISDSGEFIPTTLYEAEREKRATEGIQWPSASNLSRSYGHWLVAVRAANRFWFNGGHERVPASHTHAAGTRPSYQPKEILAALREARRDLEPPDNAWPTQWEYEEWAQIKRRLARRAGADGALTAGGDGAASRAPLGRRLPGLKQIRKAFGSYERAAQTACSLDTT